MRFSTILCLMLVAANACKLSHVVIACFATLSLISIAMAASLIGRQS